MKPTWSISHHLDWSWYFSLKLVQLFCSNDWPGPALFWFASIGWKFSSCFVVKIQIWLYLNVIRLGSVRIQLHPHKQMATHEINHLNQLNQLSLVQVEMTWFAKAFVPLAQFIIISAVDWYINENIGKGLNSAAREQFSSVSLLARGEVLCKTSKRKQLASN